MNMIANIQTAAQPVHVRPSAPYLMQRESYMLKKKPLNLFPFLHE